MSDNKKKSAGIKDGLSSIPKAFVLFGRAFKNAKKAVEVAAKMPIERLMIETDSPYMSPEPVRGTRNTSLNVRYVAEKIAALRGMSAEELARITLENGKRFYGLTAI